MANAFSFKTYYNPYISPTTNSVWGVVSVAANDVPQEAQGIHIKLRGMHNGLRTALICRTSCRCRRVAVATQRPTVRSCGVNVLQQALQVEQ